MLSESLATSLITTDLDAAVSFAERQGFPLILGPTFCLNQTTKAEFVDSTKSLSDLPRNAYGPGHPVRSLAIFIYLAREVLAAGFALIVYPHRLNS